MDTQNNTGILQNWTDEKANLITAYRENSVTLREQTINKGDIYLCKIGENIGEEQCKERPVIILSKTFYNNVSTQVTVAPLSKTIKYKRVQGRLVPKTKTHFVLKKQQYSFLSVDSCIKCEQIRSLSKIRLIHKMGTVDQQTLAKIEVRIKDLFDI